MLTRTHVHQGCGLSAHTRQTRFESDLMFTSCGDQTNNCAVLRPHPNGTSMNQRTRLVRRKLGLEFSSHDMSTCHYYLIHVGNNISEK